MKNFIILLGVAVATVLLAGVEYLTDCPFDWHFGEIIGGAFLLVIGLVWCYRLHLSTRKLIAPLIGGMLLIVAVNVATNALFLWKMLMDAYPDMNDGIFVSLTLMMAVYVPFVYIGAIWLYLYYFCDLREMFIQLKQEI